MAYYHRFDYSGGVVEDGVYTADPPTIYIAEEHEPFDWDVVQVLEDPVPTVDVPNNDDDHWALPADSLTARLLGALNAVAD